MMPMENRTGGRRIKESYPINLKGQKLADMVMFAPTLRVPKRLSQRLGMAPHKYLGLNCSFLTCSRRRLSLEH